MNNEVYESGASSKYSSRIRNENKNYNNKNRNQESFRADIIEVDNQIRSLEEQIQLTISNYETILQTQKKNTAERNEFLLYLIQSMKQKHSAELAQYQAELQTVLQQKDQASSLQRQMKNIGKGVDSILEEGRRLKELNQVLTKQLQEQNLREKQLDQDIEAHTKEIHDLRTQVEEWELKKIKWNRRKKDMLQMIDQTSTVVQQNLKVCPQTGLDQQNCDHCQSLSNKKPINKYPN